MKYKFRAVQHMGSAPSRTLQAVWSVMGTALRALPHNGVFGKS